MPITINTNASANYANFHLSRNQNALQKSLTRLSSGSRITQPIDDAGGLAVSLKLQSAITRLDGAQKNAERNLVSRGAGRRAGSCGQDHEPHDRA